MSIRVRSTARAVVERGARWYRQHPRRVFRHIHATNAWGSHESLSGWGSTLEQTAALREALPGVMQEVGASSLLDIPCGDWNWMSRTELPAMQITGGDIVPALLEANQARYGHLATFVLLDAVRSQLPRVDVIMARDLLVHLSYREVFAALANFRRSGSTYLLTTTFRGPGRVNQDIKTGDWRALNLELPPFSFPTPDFVIDERCTESDGIFADKSMALWRLSELPDHPGDRRRRRPARHVQPGRLARLDG